MNFDHFLVMTDDLPGTEAFFKVIAGLESGWRPPFPFAGSWLYADEKPIVHLAEIDSAGGDGYLGGRTGRASTYVDHIAFSGEDLPTFKARLEHEGLPYFVREVPEVGELQFFVVGPGGLKFEFIFRNIKSTEPNL